MMDTFRVVMDNALSRLSLSNYPHYPKLTRTFKITLSKNTIPINIINNDNLYIYIDVKSALSCFIPCEVIAHYTKGIPGIWFA